LNNRGIERIAIAGDSAGGGLALALLAHADRPVGAVALSPVTDLTLSGESLPAVQIIVGDAETLRDFSRRASVVCLG
jgi:acetyl esterase/lipase